MNNRLCKNQTLVYVKTAATVVLSILFSACTSTPLQTLTSDTREYEVVDSPNTLVFRQSMSNEAGEILANPQMPNWPKEMRTTIKLEEVDGKTKLQLFWQPVNPTKEEAEAFEASRAQHSHGWGAGLDQLTDYLGTL